MGDNIYLGDRNGVRTPMQWSGDRNGGFSRADPARLYAPPIMDPVYGYQAINVEAQERYPFSLLNWMKRLIAMRKQHRVFGRGSLEFVGCPNRKVLAFLRRDDRETILVVANLSSGVQPAALDLQALRRAHPDRDGGADRIPAHRREAVFSDARSVRGVLVHASARADAVTPKVTAAVRPGCGDRGKPARPAGRRRLADLSSTAARAPCSSARRSDLSCSDSRGSRPGSTAIRRARFADWTRIRGGPHPAFCRSSPSNTSTARKRATLPLALVSGEDVERALKQTPAHCVPRRASPAHARAPSSTG